MATRVSSFREEHVASFMMDIRLSAVAFGLTRGRCEDQGATNPPFLRRSLGGSPRFAWDDGSRSDRFLPVLPCPDLDDVLDIADDELAA